MLNKLARYSFFLILLGCSFQTIQSPHLGWEIARGSAVTSGTINPSQVLLRQETLADADWLGGLLTYGLSLLPDNWGLVLARVSLPLILLLVIAQGSIKSLDSRQYCLCGLWLFSASPGLEPVPIAWEILLAILAADLAKKGLAFTTRMICWFGLAICWANLGAHALVLLLIAALDDATDCDDRRPRLASCYRYGLILCGLCCCPRGPWELVDSSVVLVPRLFVEGWVVEQLGLAGPIIWTWTPALISFLLLSVIVLWQEFRQLSYGVLAVGILLSLAMLNQGLIPLVATVFLMQCLLADPSGRTIVTTQEEPTEDMPKLSDQMQHRYAGMIIILAVVFLVGVWPFQGLRWGLGIDQGIDPEECQEIVTTPGLTGSIFPTGISESSLIAWSALGLAKQPLQDYPRRAIIAGRAREWALLNRSLEMRIREIQRSVTGEKLGWYLKLRDRETRLLAVSAERTELISALEEELWKPLTLTSPVLVFARVGDPLYSRQIVETLTLRTFLDYGPWEFELNTPNFSSQPLDLTGILSGQPEIRPLRRQIRLFLAMNMDFAAMRMLHRCTKQLGHPSFQLEWKLAQRQFAVAEHIHGGRSSLFRARLIQNVKADHDEWLTWSELGWTSVPEFQDSSTWTAALTHYENGHPEAAFKMLQSISNPESIYAQAMIAMELGDISTTTSLLNQMKQLKPESHLSYLADMLLNQFSFQN